jgi:hypothetical protein
MTASDCGSTGESSEALDTATTSDDPRSEHPGAESEEPVSLDMEDRDGHWIDVQGPEGEIERFMREYEVVGTDMGSDSFSGGSRRSPQIKLDMTIPYRVTDCWYGKRYIVVSFETRKTPFIDFRAQYHRLLERYPTLTFSWGYRPARGGVGYVDDTDHCWYRDEWGNWVGIDEDAVCIDDRPMFEPFGWHYYP